MPQQLRGSRSELTHFYVIGGKDDSQLFRD